MHMETYKTHGEYAKIMLKAFPAENAHPTYAHPTYDNHKSHIGNSHSRSALSKWLSFLALIFYNDILI